MWGRYLYRTEDGRQRIDGADDRCAALELLGLLKQLALDLILSIFVELVFDLKRHRHITGIGSTSMQRGMQEIDCGKGESETPPLTCCLRSFSSASSDTFSSLSESELEPSMMSALTCTRTALTPGQTQAASRGPEAQQFMRRHALLSVTLARESPAAFPNESSSTSGAVIPLLSSVFLSTFAASERRALYRFSS